MTGTINNGIPLVPENTIDPAAGLNEALNVADALIQVDVISLTVTAPPASPAVGDRYIVPTGATGAWSGQEGKLARWEEGLFWAFYSAQFVTNNGVAYTKTSGGWAVISGSGEANTTSNLGTGEGIAAPKSGVNLPFKSLKAGPNVTITSDANEITISSTGGSGGSAEWGDIGGDIEDQADLIDLLDEKEFSLVAGTNITINRTNPKAPVISASGGSGGGQVDSVVAGEGITVDNTDPENPEVSVDFSVAEYKLTAGTGIAIDRTDPEAPVISATGGGGGMDNPMTTEGDMIVGGEDGEPERLAAGGDGQVLTIDSGVPKWKYPEYIEIEYLVVGAGGSGGPSVTTAGNVGSAGGGGGQVKTGTIVFRSGDSEPVVVGAGGAVASTGVPGNGNNGGDSKFGQITSLGGGGGAGSGTSGNLAAKSGGNGGGGSSYNTTGAAGETGGYSGGNGLSGVGSGGGGGAGANGSNAVTGQAGGGGAGLLSSISGTPTYYGAGGGAGGSSGGASAGAGGNGGGGAGGSSATTWNGVNGTANTGGGGGGAGGLAAGAKSAGNGGSGVVIARYRGIQRATGGTVTQSGGYTIHTFTSSGTFEVM